MTLSTSAVAVCCCSDSRSSLNSRAFSMGDHGLIGKGLEQSDLSLREELGLSAAECDRANRHTFSHQRDAK